MKHNKLVRDGIPEMIKRGGEKPVIRTLDAGTYRRELKQKLHEEIREFVESGRVEELVDILEVVYALARFEGVRPFQLEEMRERKRQERGGFDRRVFLVETCSRDRD